MLYFFIGCLAFGVLYSAVSAIVGPHGFGHGGFDHGGGAGGHSGTDSADAPSPFNPLVIASAVTTFGAVGLAAKAGFNMGDLLSTIVALGFAGAIGAAIFFGIIKLVYRSQSNSIFSLEDLIGSEAEVTTPIPANGTGEIDYTMNGVRSSLSARASHGGEVPRGTVVIIGEFAGNAAIVRKKMTMEDLDLFEQGQERKEEQEQKVEKPKENS